MKGKFYLNLNTHEIKYWNPYDDPLGTQYEELVPNQNEKASKETHIPQYKVYGEQVDIKFGEKPYHPMTKVHRITTAAVVTDKSVIIKKLPVPPEEITKDNQVPPYIVINLPKGEVIEGVYIYCNLHGLFMSDHERVKKKKVTKNKPGPKPRVKMDE